MKNRLLCNAWRKFILLSLITILFIGKTYSQQNITVKGFVTDSESKKPLVGVSVTINASGTTTDSKGGYSIVAQKGTSLTFEHIGYAKKTVIVGDQNIIDIELATVASQNAEVVVIAYGRQKKATVTGAIATIQTREIKQSPASNLAVTLAGRLPGLTAIQTSGEPGREATKLFIRGLGTVNAQNPIVLVDGIERDLTYVDPNEIESISILKDASSTAIFGVRGANGVILVTTKRGTSEKPIINFTAEKGVQQFTRTLERVNSWEFATLRNLALTNDGLPAAFSQTAIDHYKAQDEPDRYPNTNWRKLLMKDFSQQDRYNLNISGSSKAMKYFVNAGYLNQGGLYKVEKNLPYDPSYNLKRFNFRSNIDLQINTALKAYLNVAGYLETQNMPLGFLNFIGNTGDVLQGLSPSGILWNDEAPPIVPGPLAPDGGVMTYDRFIFPPYGQLNRSGYVKQDRSNVTATYGMEQSLDFITKGLSAKAVMSFDTKATNDLIGARTYLKELQIIDPNLKDSKGRDSMYYRAVNTWAGSSDGPITISGVSYYQSQPNFQGYLNYARTFSKHAVTGLLLYQQQKTIIGSQLPFNLRGFASRVTYGFDNKYLFEFNAGYNGSEQFAKGRRFGFFPAFSGGWVVTNEKFFQNLKLSAIDRLKFRASYGLVGNDRMGDRRFLYLDDIKLSGGGYIADLFDGQMITTALLANKKLQWEVAKKLDVGVELEMFGGFSLVADVFRERRDNILRPQGTIPVLNGLSSSVLPPLNSGIVENKGYEVELNYKKAVSKDLSFLSKLNLAYARNKQIAASENKLTSDYAVQYRQTGFRIGQPFGYVVDRYFTSDDDISKSPVQNVGGHASRPGDFKYVDENKDGIINNKDMVPIGYSTVPEYQFGAAASVTYKAFDISILFQGITNVSNFYSGNGVFANDNYVTRHLQSWTQERYSKGEPINYPRLTTQGSPNEIPNSFFIVDASYIRLKNLEIGYTLPVHLSKKIKSNYIRFYLNGLNLISWDKLPTKDFDPEISGIGSYPMQRIFNGGVNITF